MKKNRWKRVPVCAALCLAAALFFGCTAGAETTELDDDSNSNTFTYYIDSDTGCLTITGNGTMGKVGVDTGQKGHKFVANRPWALTKAKAKKIKSINIGEGITAIPAGAFSALPNLKTVRMPDTVTSIGKYAFYNCKSLRLVQLSAKLQSVGTEAFYHCEKLTSLSFGASLSKIGARAFFGAKSLCSLKVDKENSHFVTKADGLYSKNKKTLYAYANGISGAVQLAKTTVRIKSGAFAYGKFSKVTIPASVRVVEGGAFYGCKRLKTVSFAKNARCKALQGYERDYGDGVKQSFGVFGGCKRLQTFIGGKKLTWMGSRTFRGCSRLKQVTLYRSFRYFKLENGKKTTDKRKTSLKNVEIRWRSVA